MLDMHLTTFKLIGGGIMEIDSTATVNFFIQNLPFPSIKGFSPKKGMSMTAQEL